MVCHSKPTKAESFYVFSRFELKPFVTFNKDFLLRTSEALRKNLSLLMLIFFQDFNMFQQLFFRRSINLNLNFCNLLLQFISQYDNVKRILIITLCEENFSELIIPESSQLDVLNEETLSSKAQKIHHPLILSTVGVKYHQMD